MKFILEIDSLTADPVTLGEFLRGVMFVGKGLGCYTNFDVNPLWVKTSFEEDDFYTLFGRLPADEDDWVFQEAVCFFSPDGIRGVYLWDGDGVLGFTLPDGIRIVNTDCKKDYCWSFVL